MIDFLESRALIQWLCVPLNPLNEKMRVVPKLSGPFHNRSEILPFTLIVFQLACPKNSEFPPN